MADSDMASSNWTKGSTGNDIRLWKQKKSVTEMLLGRPFSL